MIFGFFKKESDEDRVARERQEASIQCLERGELPLRAQERLKKFQAEGGKLFTSDLSCNELLLVEEAGYQVVGQVMGSCFMNISLFGSWSSYLTTTGEMTDRTNGLMQARYLAVSRLKQEIKGLGAHGAIGIKLEVKFWNWASRLIEVTAIGTAIKIPGRPESGDPFTCDLSGQEFWQLYEAGHWPVGLIIGASCYYVHTDGTTYRQLQNFWGMNNFANQELPLYTQSFNDAYNRAVGRLTTQSLDANAEGIVGVNVSHSIQDIEYETNNTRYHDMLITVMANGTAIRKDEHPRETRTFEPLMIMDVRKGSAKRHVTVGAENAAPRLSE